MLPTFQVIPSLLLFYIFFNIHNHLIEKFPWQLALLSLLGTGGQPKPLQWILVGGGLIGGNVYLLKRINILLSTSLDLCRAFIHGILFYTICLKDSFHIFIIFCFIYLLLSKFLHISIILYGALLWGRRKAHLKFCSWNMSPQKITQVVMEFR